MAKIFSSPGIPSRVEIVESCGDRSGESITGLTDREYSQIYERHATDILRYATRCTGRRDVAEDLASEAFLRMFENRARIDGSRAVAWLTAAVKNLAIDYWRHGEVERRHSISVVPPASEFPGERRWEEILAHPSLKPEHRDCLALHYVHGYERMEIAAVTGLTGNQVKSNLQYGLKLLRKVFGVDE